ncbi:amino acid ABC transporter substrate-binding protein, partial [bacterium]
MTNRYPGLVRIGVILSVLAGAWPSHSLADDIVIGIPVNLSGANAMTGRMERNSYLLAAEEINAADGINGETLVLDMRDTRGEPSVARSIVNHFINVKKYPVIVGTSGSDETITVAALCEKWGVPFLAVSGAEESITKRGYRYTFRINPSFHAYPSGVLGFLDQVVKPERLAVIYERSDLAGEIASVVSAAGNEHGWKVTEFVYEFGTRNFLPLLDQVGEFGPDVVFLMSYAQDAVLIIDNLKGNFPDLKAFISGLPSQTESRVTGVFGDHAEHLFVMSLWSPRLPYYGAERYFNKYVKRFGTEP